MHSENLFLVPFVIILDNCMKGEFTNYYAWYKVHINKDNLYIQFTVAVINRRSTMYKKKKKIGQPTSHWTVKKPIRRASVIQNISIKSFQFVLQLWRVFLRVFLPPWLQNIPSVFCNCRKVNNGSPLLVLRV